MIVNDHDGFEVYQHGGESHRLCLTQTPTLLRASIPPISDLLGDMPQSEYQVKIYRSVLDVSNFTLNQRSHGSCVGFATAAAMMKLRFGMGQLFQRLSGAFVYSFINGGRDQGANIGEALKIAQQGVCLESEADWDAIYPNRIPASARTTAKRFRALEIYRVDSWSQCCTALQMGFSVVYAVHVGSSFDRLDSDGVIGLDRGPGNHAVHAFGMDKSAGGVWLADGYNSWGPAWGDQGRFRSSQKHWESVQQDAFAIRDVIWDPQDLNQPPVAKRA